jgi:hypothetical protein
MPTGYTAAINDNCSFEEFVLQCSRAMGASIMLRDDPDTVLPTPENVSDLSEYYPKQLATSERLLKSWNKMPRIRRKRLYCLEMKRSLHYIGKRIAESLSLKKKYERMLKKVKAWNPPSSEHENFKEFMERQIVESIDFDCDTKYTEKKMEIPCFDTWESDYEKELVKDIKYYKEKIKEELSRNSDRANWIADVWKSLGLSPCGTIKALQKQIEKK